MRYAFGLLAAVFLVCHLALAGPGAVQATVRVSRGTSIAQACPISEKEALTNRHVIESSPGTWSAEDGAEGSLEMKWIDRRRDLALAVSDVPFPRWNPIAGQRPAVGEIVELAGYNSDKPGLPVKVVQAKVTGYLPGGLLYDQGPGQGSSGSCVINARGELVGIAWGGYDTPNRRHWSAVALYPPWWPVPEKWRTDPNSAVELTVTPE